jgi:hypothetical protein
VQQGKNSLLILLFVELGSAWAFSGHQQFETACVVTSTVFQDGFLGNRKEPTHIGEAKTFVAGQHC